MLIDCVHLNLPFLFIYVFAVTSAQHDACVGASSFFFPKTVCRYSQNILLLREQVDDTQRRVASLEGEDQQGDPLVRERVQELQSQLGTLRGKMHQMETLKKSFSERRWPEVRVASVCFTSRMWSEFCGDKEAFLCVCLASENTAGRANEKAVERCLARSKKIKEFSFRRRTAFMRLWSDIIEDKYCFYLFSAKESDRWTRPLSTSLRKDSLSQKQRAGSHEGLFKILCFIHLLPHNKSQYI